MLLALTSCLALAPLQQASAWRQYATPEEAGFSAERLAEAWELADRIGSAAVFAVHRGHVLLAWGEVERRYECHSVRKSLMNALIGLAVEQKTLQLDDTLAELGIDDLQGLTAAEKRATLSDLLGSRSGVYHPGAKEPADMRAERPARGSHPPGEFFFYNNWDCAGSLPSYPTLNAHDLFAAIGTGGQLVLVAPGAELVLVHRGDTDNEREVGGRDCWKLAEQILAARTGSASGEPELTELRVEPFTHPLPARPDHAPAAVDPDVYEGLAGEYEFQGFTVRVFLHEGRLFAHRDDGDEMELLPLSPTRHFLFTTSFEIEFERDGDGRPHKVRLLTPRGTLEGVRAGGG